MKIRMTEDHKHRISPVTKMVYERDKEYTLDADMALMLIAEGVAVYLSPRTGEVADLDPEQKAALARVADQQIATDLAAAAQANEEARAEIARDLGEVSDEELVTIAGEQNVEVSARKLKGRDADGYRADLIERIAAALLAAAGAAEGGAE